jgi:hypothetical protein
MSLSNFVQSLINESKTTSRFLRAIRLFELQIALFYPRSFGRLLGSESDATEPTGRQRMARLFAAIRILEKIEADLTKHKNVSVISIRDLAADEDFKTIFDHAVAPSGWRRIRRLISARAFDRTIKDRGREAQAVANIIDFSYRFSIHGRGLPHDGRTNPGGVDSARYVARKAYKPSMARTTMKNRWKKYRPSAIFLYLMLKQNFDLQPPRVTSKNFVETLLGQADNVSQLRRFFRAYQLVRAALLELKYIHYPALDLDLQSSDPQLDAPEFPPDIRAKWEKWLTDDRGD